MAEELFQHVTPEKEIEELTHSLQFAWIMENGALKNAAVECLLTRLENEEKKDLNEILRLINTLSIMEEYDSLFKRAN